MLQLTMIELVVGSATVAALLTVWMGTDVFNEYVRALPFIRDWLGVTDAIKLGETYVEYLTNHKSGFFVRLLICELCLGFWLSMIVSGLLGIFSAVFAVYFFGLLGYFTLTWVSKR